MMNGGGKWKILINKKYLMMSKKLYGVKCNSQREFGDIIKWGKENGYHPYGETESSFFGASYLIFYEDGDMCSSKIPNLICYSFKEFKEKYMKKETFEVDKEFIMEAYGAACNDWKNKIKDKFPNAFPNHFRNAEVGTRFKNIQTGEEAMLAFFISNVDGGKYLLINLTTGIAHHLPNKDKEKVTLFPENFVKISE